MILFVTKFDVLVGYSLIHQYSANNDKFKLDSIEYKALPSGLHQSSFDTVRFKYQLKPSDGNEAVVYNGVSIFRQNGMEEGVDSNDRKSLKMYTVGVLFKNDDDIDQVELLLLDLDRTLLSFIIEKTKDPNSNVALEKMFLEQIESKFRAYTSHLESKVSKKQVRNDVSFEDSLSYVGPYFYKLWRYTLVNKRILIKNQFDKNEGANNNGIIDKNTLLIKHLVDLVQKVPEMLNSDFGTTSEALYNVTLHDLETLKSYTRQQRGYLASTSDDLILTKLNLFDYMLDFDTLTRLPMLKAVVSGNTTPLDCTLQAIRFSKADMANFINLQFSDDHTNANDDISRQSMPFDVFDKWKTSLDNSWAALLCQWIYGIPISFPTINNYGLIDETSAFKDATSATTAGQDQFASSKDTLSWEKIRLHFEDILSHYQKTCSDIIQNNDEDYAAKQSLESFYNEDVLDDSSAPSETALLADQDLDDEGVTIVELYLSDVHQLYLNPFSSDDKSFVRDYIKHHFHRTARVSSALDFLQWNPFSCC